MPHRSQPFTSVLLALDILCWLAGSVQASAAQITVQVTPAADQSPSELNGAVIYLRSTATTPGDTPPSNTQVAQQGRLFNPYISVVQAGSEIAFPNRDNIAHHVYSFSSTRAFELPLYKGSLAPTITFDKPGLVTLGCNIHDWMLGYILVLDTPYYQRLNGSRKGAKAVFDGVPAGDYTLHFWAPGIDRREPGLIPVTISDQSQALELPLQFPLRFQTQPQPPESDFDELDEY